MWRVTSDPFKFQEALDFFLKKVPLTKDQLASTSEEALQRAFFISGVTQADMLQDAFDALSKAVEGQLSFKEFQKQFEADFIKAWGNEKNPGHRVEVIFRQNIQNAHNAGREEQLFDADVLKARPYHEFDAIMDDKTSAICSSLNGVIREASDPFWDDHTPALHFLCRSVKKSLTKKQAERKGITADDELPLTQADAGFGKKPTLSNWTPDLGKYEPELQKSLKKNLDL